MKGVRFRLSLEELSFAMGLLDGQDAASAFLLTALGERDQREIEGRLYAAAHSLIARDCLRIAQDDQQVKKHLDESLARVVRTMLDHDYYIRCSRTMRGIQDVVTYFIGGVAIVESCTLQDVVVSLETVNSDQEVKQRCFSFFDLPTEVTDVKETSLVGTIPLSMIEEARSRIQQKAEGQVTSMFAESGLSENAASQLTNGLVHEEVRGSVVRVERQKDHAVSSAGFLLLKEPDRYWLLEIVAEDPPKARVFAGNEQQFRTLLANLF